MTWIPRTWAELTEEEVANKELLIYGEPHKCSYCGSKEVRYKGSIWIAGGVGSFFYLACEDCHKKFKKMRPGRGAPPHDFGSKYGNYMQGSGYDKGGLNTNGRGLSD